MKTDSFIRVLAGSMILLSLALSLLINSWWLLLAAFVSVSLIQSAFTGFCPPTLLLEKLGRVRSDGTIGWSRRPQS